MAKTEENTCTIPGQVIGGRRRLNALSYMGDQNSLPSSALNIKHQNQKFRASEL